MRFFIYKLLAVSVLFMGIEGAWDMTKESHAHRDNLTHHENTGDHGSVNPDPLSDSDDNQCGHLCHGHMSSITGDSEESSFMETDSYIAFSPFPITNHSQAPPTPPPNA
jgi:hypothetical protein